MDKPKKERADSALVLRGLVESREKARAVIMAGVAYRNEEKILKPSDMIAPGEALTVRGAPHPYVSRGGLKLEKALAAFQIDPSGLTCIDLGASTGGFTDVLLQRGAARVYAVDVGFGQLDWKIRSDARVVTMERTNARAIEPTQFAPAPVLGVMDVSFISILLILPAAARVLGEDGRMVTLIKPQFEAGRDRVGKKGVVGDPAVHESVIAEIVAKAPGTGWAVQALSYSPITGPEGNIEFLADLCPIARARDVHLDVPALVATAHASLKRKGAQP